MNLKILTDECLLSETKRLVQQERELLTTILHHLLEIERRRLFGEHTSLHAYAVGALGYSDDMAYRRVAAMRLLKELPEIEDHLAAGHLNLSHWGVAQSVFKRERKAGRPLSPETKLELLAEMAGRSTREAEAVAQRYSTEPPKFRETIRPNGRGRDLVTIELSDEVLRDLDGLRGLLAHEHPNMTLAGLLQRLSRLAQEQWNPARPTVRNVSPVTKAAIRREIWRRDSHACVKCKSRFAVQEDHITPASMGGAYTLENVRLLCRSCNQRAAIEKLGLDKMARYLAPEYRWTSTR